MFRCIKTRRKLKEEIASLNNELQHSKECIQLNEDQRIFSNEVVRPFNETLVRIIYELESFIRKHDALQKKYPLPHGISAIDDGRSDAPKLTCTDIRQLRDYAASMSAIIPDKEMDILINNMVRDLPSVIQRVK